MMHFLSGSPGESPIPRQIAIKEYAAGALLANAPIWILSAVLPPDWSQQFVIRAGLMNYIITMAGGMNAASSLQGDYAQISAEELIAVNPEIIFGVLRKNLEKVSLHILAIGIRLVIGILLILYSNESKYPTIIEILGWLSIAAAFIFSVIGRRRFLSLMSWALSLLKPYGRIGGLFAMAFGGFLIYAFV